VFLFVIAILPNRQAAGLVKLPIMQPAWHPVGKNHKGAAANADTLISDERLIVV